MSLARFAGLQVLVLVALIGAGCGGAEETPAVLQAAVAQYVDPDAEFPRLRFVDGQISLNDRCPVRRSKLNRRLPPIRVNGRPIGFC